LRTQTARASGNDHFGRGHPNARKRKPTEFLHRGFSCSLVSQLEMRSLDDGEDVILGHDEVLLSVQNHFIARVGGEQHAVAYLHLESRALAVLEQLAVTRTQDLALLAFL